MGESNHSKSAPRGFGFFSHKGIRNKKNWENSWQFLGKGQNTTAGGGATAIQDRRIFAGSESEYPVIKYPANYS